MSAFLLQITTAATVAADSAAAATNVPVADTTDLSLLDLILKGGWIMVPIFLLSFVSIYIMIERYITIRRAATIPGGFMGSIKSLMVRGDLQGAKMLCAQTPSPLARMIEKGIRRIGLPLQEIEASVENVGKIEVARLEKGIGVLGIIAGIAPMLGFVGTIIGVIKIFYSISTTGDFGIAQISGGLYTKMVTSAAGLIVGIIAHIGYHWLSIMVENLVLRMENSAVEFMDILQDN
ncbi:MULTISPECIES: MotA/TolQ/ExbB proton channel family protein [Hymenobacter]|uniref:MotA/TolQ/ExbB proton channel family protein n=2 Tax=Hymenobacter TaxID=89966 RepID=A0ABS6X1S9_9BACT|nr:MULTISPECIES: MotA/TolQ/ExbB proton channel family protein [Hymenobacter]MBO3269685.1 MotA/TolQ/ExbB proton channel family protein [Hymenobacter defluvii]MBW3129780.1 MotA/TolQ/ExbB proton channel family protein [Hymenobacter profundi]QNE39347.1 MotA/TolQ/ExbB proton channel family protein [Hymenobacter sp. NBH84]